MKSKEFWIYDNPEWNNPSCYRGEPTWGCEPDDTGRVVHVVEASVVTDLLEALNSVVNSDMAMREEDEGRKSAVLDKARAAIARAEGREVKEHG